MSAHQYGISVADAQTSLLMKRPYQQRASIDGCFHRLENLLVLDDLKGVFSIFVLMDSFYQSTAVTRSIQHN